MRRSTSSLLAAGLASALLLTGCGSSGSDTTDSSSSSSSSPAAPTADFDGLPKISAGDKFGEKPTVEVVDTKPPEKIEAQVLSEGDGAVVGKGDLLVANYLGQTWTAGDGGKANVFDNSYDRSMPAGFGIGVGKVVAGWDDVLVGKKVGSRVLMALPAEKGYGDEGQPSAGIPGGATLVFVVDVVATYAPDAAASGTAVPAPEGFPAVASEPGKEPMFTSTEGVAAPAEVKSAILVEGDGAPIEDGKQLALQFTSIDLATGQMVQKSWGESPIGLPDATQVPGLAEALKGKKVGTRVMLLLPEAQSSAGGASLIFDIVGQY